jgi:hypothetical protein
MQASDLRPEWVAIPIRFEVARARVRSANKHCRHVEDALSVLALSIFPPWSKPCARGPRPAPTVRRVSAEPNELHFEILRPSG